MATMSTIATIFLTGTGMGIIHVLTGPDHLSALATLSANIDTCQAFGYGIRWGIGHSIGLLVVGSILIMIDYYNHYDDGNDNDNKIGISESFENFCEMLVGIFMVMLGLYGLRSTSWKHGQGNDSSDDVIVDNSIDTLLSSRFNGNINDDYSNNNNNIICPNKSNNDTEEGGVFELSPSSLSSSSSSSNHLVKANIENGEASLSLADVSYDVMGTHTTANNNINTIRRNISSLFYHHHHLDENDRCNHINKCCCVSCSCCNNNFSKPFLSLCIGIVHGVAGPGGVLGVIPAVQLHDWKLATFYLLTFCTISTLTMGSYAALYGRFSSYISSSSSSGDNNDRGNVEAAMEYKVELFSSGLSLFVGVLWLFLLSIGKLHDIFP